MKKMFQNFYSGQKSFLSGNIHYENSNLIISFNKIHILLSTTIRTTCSLTKTRLYKYYISHDFYNLTNKFLLEIWKWKAGCMLF